MKKLVLSIIITFAATHLFAATTNPVDSLQKQLDVATNDTTKAALYTKMANNYMVYSAIQDRYLKSIYQENVINGTLKALHYYYRMDDSTGMRTCYDRLSKVYRDQRKYSQAKWFILQANTMAREQKDVPNIIETLINLAGIKMDIKDYYLAKRDLAEALELSSANRFANQQSAVMMAYARYYNHTGELKKASASIQRFAYIKDSMKRDTQARMATKVVVKKRSYSVLNTKSLSKKQAIETASL